MKNAGRLLFYILLNILISAGTTLLVLNLWERDHPLPAAPIPQATAVQIQPTQPPDQPAALPPSEGIPTLPPEQAGDVINNVFGTGNLNDEYVLLVNKHDSPLVLTGWQLRDAGSAAFTFPTFTLNKDGAVRVHSGPGTNSAIDLFWNRDTAAWSEGATVTLVDSQGVSRCSYQIP